MDRFLIKYPFLSGQNVKILLPYMDKNEKIFLSKMDKVKKSPILIWTNIDF